MYIYTCYYLEILETLKYNMGQIPPSNVVLEHLLNCYFQFINSIEPDHYQIHELGLF